MRITTFIVVFLWLLVFTFCNFYYINQDNTPPNWDEAYYLQGTEYLLQSFKSDGVIGLINASTKVSPRKPPLITYLPFIPSLIFGNSFKIALLTNVVYLLTFIIFFYLLVSKVYPKKIAIIAIIIFLTFPLSYGLFRHFYVEFGLMSIVVVWIYLLLKTENLQNNIFLFWLGVASGLGLLMKLHFFIFIIGPFLYSVYLYWQTKPSINQLFNKGLILLVSTLTITLPWYSKNILVALWHAKKSTDPTKLGDHYYYGSAFSQNNIYKSTLDFINYQISGYYFLLFIFLFLFLIVQGKHLKKINYYLASWFVIPFLVFFFGPNKDYRFYLPILPTVAIFISYLYSLVTGNKFWFFIPIILLIPTLIFVNFSFKNSYISNLNLGPIIINQQNMGDYIHHPKSNLWPDAEILQVIRSYSPNYAITSTVLLASDHYALNINNLQYFQYRDSLNLKIIALDFPDGSNNDPFILADFLVFKEQNVNPKFRNSLIKVLNSPMWVEINKQFILPDGDKLHIFKKVADDSFKTFQPIN